MAFERRAIGIICIALVVFLWVGSSELIQLIFDDPIFRFESPLFLTFYSTSLFSIYLCGFACSTSWRRSWSDPSADIRAEAQDEERDLLLDELGRDERFEGKVDGESDAAMPSACTTMKLAAQFAPMWIAANLSFNASLCRSCSTGTSVSSITLISSSSGVFTLIFSILFLGDTFSWAKLACVLLSMSGVCLLVMYDGTKLQAHNSWGDLLALASAMLMGGYSVQLKHMLGARDSPSISMPMFFGFLGVAAAMLGIPIFIGVVLLRVTGWAHLELLSTLISEPGVIAALTLNGLFGTVLSDLLWAEAVLRTSPLAVNLSICLTIPLAFVLDYVRGVVVQPPQALYVLGGVFVFVAFVGVHLMEYWSASRREIEDVPANANTGIEGITRMLIPRPISKYSPGTRLPHDDDLENEQCSSSGGARLLSTTTNT